MKPKSKHYSRPTSSDMLVEDDHKYRKDYQPNSFYE